ncbi:hypothetical protein CEXT_481431 [Caerostris extrusa]|uniref:Uncharacterized protein n=1 Tax=Caerostris extrusa TaxID=172846 RepID=A0AAV4W9M2_CAEEX|nr:hypothetical protein CEXT_481431 [Caerostris extrusa]
MNTQGACLSIRTRWNELEQSSFSLPRGPNENPAIYRLLCQDASRVGHVNHFDSYERNGRKRGCPSEQDGNGWRQCSFSLERRPNENPAIYRLLYQDASRVGHVTHFDSYETNGGKVFGEIADNKKKNKR